MNYTKHIGYFLSWTQRQGILPTKVRYADLLLFLQYCQKQGSRNLNNLVQKLLSQLRAIHLEMKHLQQIRQSVIAHCLKSLDVRQVQYLAGHKWVSSTERYRQTDLEDLQHKLDKYHPLQ